MQSMALKQRQAVGRRPSVQHTRSTLLRTAAWSLPSSSQASVSDDGPEVTKTPWYKKPCPGFKDVASTTQLKELLTNNGGKMTLVDCYAGWCSCCKGAFPSLCKIPSLGDYSQHYQFLKLNIDGAEDAKSFIKEYEVRGIPYAMVFDDQGKFVIGMGASFKKLEALKQNLHKIADAKAAGQPLDFVLDPNGFATPR